METNVLKRNCFHAVVAVFITATQMITLFSAQLCLESVVLKCHV